MITPRVSIADSASIASPKFWIVCVTYLLARKGGGHMDTNTQAELLDLHELVRITLANVDSLIRNEDCAGVNAVIGYALASLEPVGVKARVIANACRDEINRLNSVGV